MGSHQGLKDGRASPGRLERQGMYLGCCPPRLYEGGAEPHLRKRQDNGGAIEALGSIRMLTADRKVLTGWLASQTDILSEDWEIVGEGQP